MRPNFGARSISTVRFDMKKKSRGKLQSTGTKVKKDLPKGVRLVRTLEGHEGAIGRVAWSPDGRILASPSADRTVRLWDVKSGQCLQVLKDHREVVQVAAFSPTGDLLASGGGDEGRGEDF